MGYEQMPHDGLKSFRVRCDSVLLNNGNENAGVGQSCGIAAVTTDNADNAGSCCLRIVECSHDIGTDVPLQTSAPDRKNENHVTSVHPADLQPGCEHGFPAFIID